MKYDGIVIQGGSGSYKVLEQDGFLVIQVGEYAESSALPDSSPVDLPEGKSILALHDQSQSVVNRLGRLLDTILRKG